MDDLPERSDGRDQDIVVSRIDPSRCGGRQGSYESGTDHQGKIQTTASIVQAEACRLSFSYATLGIMKVQGITLGPPGSTPNQGGS